MRTVLVVDDEPFVRVSMATLRTWKDDGFDFRYEAGNGRQALEVLDQHPEVDVILVDLSMPVMDGIAFLQALPAHPTRSVIVLSAHDDYPLVRKAFTLGVNDYLLKTEVDGDSLLAILSKVTRGLPSRGQVPRETNPAPDDLGALLRGRAGDLAIPLPATLWGLWVRDFEVVASRYGQGDLPRFRELFVRAVRQVLDKRGPGLAASMDDDCVAALVDARVDEGFFASELKESLERYLSVRLEVRSAPGLAEASSLAPAWADLEGHRSGVSRIVVLTKRYLREHSARPVIPLDELAAHVGVSRNHLSWEFTRETGETITDYLARLRVEEACRLLVGTTLKVYEIAEKVGYPSVEHFCRVFKKVTGSSPNRWASATDRQVFASATDSAVTRPS